MKFANHMWRLMAAALLASATIVSAQSENAIQKANAAYRAGDFRAAIESYQAAEKSGVVNAALFYDLGNAFFRAGDFGHAILNYERALALKPQHPEAAANLQMAQDKAHALELRPTWWENAAEHATRNQWTIAAAVGFWLAIFCFAGWSLARRRSLPLILGGLLALVLAVGCGAAAYGLETGRRGHALAIVTEANTQARVATADNASSVLALPAGSEITILSTRGDWIYASLPNDLRGWLPVESAQRVRM